MRERVVKDAEAAANHGAPFAGQVVGKADARGKVVEVLVVRRPLLKYAAGRVVAAQVVVRLVDHPVIIPAQAEIRGQPRRYPDRVLQIKRVRVLQRLPRRIAVIDVATGYIPLKEALQIGKL